MKAVPSFSLSFQGLEIGILCSGAGIDQIHLALGSGLLVMIECLQGRSVFPYLCALDLYLSQAEALILVIFSSLFSCSSKAMSLYIIF